MPIQADIDNVLDPLLAVFNTGLEATIEGELTTIYLSGDVQMIEWAGRPYEGPPMQQAVSFAQRKGATLVTQMTEETKRRLAKTISDAIQNKRGIPGLARDIRKTFDNMTKYRSELIARTETADALGEAFMDRGREFGVTGKEWLTVGDDRVSPECQMNEIDGVIPFEQAHSSGAMRPPQHPACRCAEAPAMLR